MTQAHVGSLLDFHETGNYLATIAVRRYIHHVPFGCVDLDGVRVVGLEEKPALQKVVNAGMYALSSALLQNIINVAGPLSMPDLLSRCIAEGGAVGAWEVEDDWIDVGQREQLEKARGER